MTDFSSQMKAMVAEHPHLRGPNLSSLFKSPAGLQNERLGNEFRRVDGTLAGLVNQRGRQAGRDVGRAPRAAGMMQQRELVDLLAGQVAGQGPGQEIARRQAEMAAQSGIQSQMAQAAGQRGGGSQLAGIVAAQNSARISGGAADAATMGGLQAQQQAIGGQLNAMGQIQQNRQFNAGMQMNQNQLQQQRELELLRQQLAAAQGYEGARTSRFSAIAGTPPAPTGGQMILGALGGIAAARAGR